MVADTMFAGGMRTVRCGRCRHEWLASPPEDDSGPEVSPPPPAPEPPPPRRPPVPQPTDEDGWGGEADVDVDEGRDDPGPGPVPGTRPAPEMRLAELTRERAAGSAVRPAGLRPARRRTPGWVWAGWVVLVLFLGGTGAALVLARESLVAAWPPVARLYVAVPWLVVDSRAGPPVTLEVESSEIVGSAGKQQMNLVIRLTNLTGESQPAPIAVIHLMDGRDKDVRTERIRLSSEPPLGPKETRQLGLRLDDLPPGLEKVRGEAGDASEQ